MSNHYKQIVKRYLRGASGAEHTDADDSLHSTSLESFRFIDDLQNTLLSSSLAENHASIEALFEDCSDVSLRPFTLQNGTKALIVFVDGLIQTQFVNEAMKSLMLLTLEELTIDQILQKDLPISQAQVEDNYANLLVGVLSGDTCLLVDGQAQAIMIGMRGPSVRSISEPETEAVIRGPREGFVENLRINTSLLRRKIKTPHLKMRPLMIGKQSNTNIVVTYMQDIVNPSLVEEVLMRLQKINMDGVLESGYIEELIQDDAFSPFPQMQYTERPDVVASALLEGRVAILIDGTPFVLIVPFVFVNILQASEDYYERFQISTLLRWLRYIFLFLSLTGPALFVAITTFHHELIPTSLLLSIAAAREAIPFPAVVEAFMMEITFEALREAGIRLPKAIGSAVSILGALVIGQAAVQAGIVSAPMVIIISITGIASFTIPRFNGAIAIRMLRFPILIAASMFGILGIFCCMFLIVGHLASLRSFGIPYLSPLAPFSIKDLKDALVRAPLWDMQERPAYLNLQDNVRMNNQLSENIRREGGLHHTQPSNQSKAGNHEDEPTS